MTAYYRLFSLILTRGYRYPHEANRCPVYIIGEN